MVDYAIIVAVIIGLVELAKSYLPTRALPLLSTILGVISGLIYVEGTIAVQVFIGIALGLSACGLFDVAKLTTKKK